MEDTKEILTVESIRNCVYIIRGQQVMLDSDLASIYGYEVKRLNEQVKRNINSGIPINAGVLNILTSLGRCFCALDDFLN